MWYKLMGNYDLCRVHETRRDGFHTSNDIIRLLQFRLRRQNEEDNECGHGGQWYLLIHAGAAQRETHPSIPALSKIGAHQQKPVIFPSPFGSLWRFQYRYLLRWVAILGRYHKIGKSDQWNGGLGTLLQKRGDSVFTGHWTERGPVSALIWGAQHPSWESRGISAVSSWSLSLWDPFTCSS